MCTPVIPRRCRRFGYSNYVIFAFALTLLILFTSLPLNAAVLPTGFTETLIANGLSNATAMVFAPDGRLFVCLQGGQLRVITQTGLLPIPFVTVTVNSLGERGLLGVAFDPDFANNPFVYVYYTATTPAIHNRISRFTANGNVAAPGSEAVILELSPDRTGSAGQIVEIFRTIGAPLSQTRTSGTYDFASWSDNGGISHQITTPAVNTTYTATYIKRKRNPR